MLYTADFFAPEKHLAIRNVEYFFSIEKKIARVNTIHSSQRIVNKFPIKVNTQDDTCFRYVTEASNNEFKLDVKVAWKDSCVKLKLSRFSRIYHLANSGSQLIWLIASGHVLVVTNSLMLKIDDEIHVRS